MNKTLFKPVFSVILSTLLTCCAVLNTHAQYRDSLLNVYNNQTIHTFDKHYIKGGKRISFADLKPEFSAGIAKDLYKKSKGNRTLSRVFTFTSIAADIAGAILKKNNTSGAWIFPLFGAGLNLGSLHFKKQSKELIDMAIWHRNKEILFGVQE